MTCHNCRTECKRKGRDRKGNQRYQCRQCSKTFLEPQEKPLDGMYLPLEKAELVLKLLLEGNSVSSVERLTEIHHTTILKLLVLAGERCERFLSETIRNMRVKDVEADELWCFVQKKEGHKRADEAAVDTIGDAYTFVGIERNTKLVLAWHLGRRTKVHTMLFMQKLRNAVNPQHWFQLTADGFPPYVPAVAYYFNNIDFAQLVKVYRASSDTEQRYSPGEVAECIPTPVFGNPRPEKICTSHVERANLSMRMHMRRFTRLTNGFSKKWANLNAMLALYFAFYNFVRVHRTLRVTPAMAANVSDHVWKLRELLTFPAV